MALFSKYCLKVSLLDYRLSFALSRFLVADSLSLQVALMLARFQYMFSIVWFNEATTLCSLIELVMNDGGSTLLKAWKV